MVRKPPRLSRLRQDKDLAIYGHSMLEFITANAPVFIMIALLMMFFSKQFNDRTKESSGASNKFWRFAPLGIVLLILLSSLINGWHTGHYTSKAVFSEIFTALAISFSFVIPFLPSLKELSSEERELLVHTYNRYTALMIFLLSPLLFPERFFLFTSDIHAIDYETNYYEAILLILPFWFAGEIWSAMFSQVEKPGVKKLARSARIKTIILPIAYLFLLDWQDQSSWASSTSNNFAYSLSLTNDLIDSAILLIVYFTLTIAIFLLPGHKIDLKFGDKGSESKTILVSYILLIPTLILTQYSFLQQFEFNFDPLIFSFKSTGLIMVITTPLMLLPNLGFDSSARPEMMWMRLGLFFSPLILFQVDSYYALTIPAVWFALFITIWIGQVFEERESVDWKAVVIFSIILILTHQLWGAGTYPGVLLLTFIGMIMLLESQIWNREKPNENA